MRHNPASGAIIIMLRSLKMHGMAQAVGELTEQGSPAFEAALAILSQLLKAETADREVRSTAYPGSVKYIWASMGRLGSSGLNGAWERTSAKPRSSTVSASRTNSRCGVAPGALALRTIVTDFASPRKIGALDALLAVTNSAASRSETTR